MKRNRIDSLSTAGSFFIFMMLVLCAAILMFAIMTPISIIEAMEHPNILNIQRQLETKGPFEARVRSWTEKKAMENVVANYNKESVAGGNKQYEIHELSKNHFLITDEEMQEDEISVMTISGLYDRTTGHQTKRNEDIFGHTVSWQTAKTTNISNNESAKGNLSVQSNNQKSEEVIFVTLIV